MRNLWLVTLHQRFTDNSPLSRAEEAAALERQVAGGAGAGVALRCMRLENELVQARVRDGVTRAALDEWREKALALQRRARAAAPEMAE